MADITSDVTIDHIQTQGLTVARVETPTDADNGDTIDLGPNGTGTFEQGCVVVSVNNTNGASLVDTSASGGWGTSVTLPGSGTGEKFELVCIGV